MRAYELRRSGLHGGQIERGPYPVAGVVGERIIHPRVQNVVAVGLGVGGVTRVEAVRNGPDVHCADVRRQVGVERGHDFLHRHFASIAEAERETSRMDAGIGAGAIDRDKERLIPYIQKAKTYAPDLKLFASPWSPPTWMKNPPVYNWGKLIWEPKNLQAYADYFVRFVKEYQHEGITIDQIHVQNEPVANQKFPSCMWTGAELKEFIRDYLGPMFKKNGLDTEIWLGTINAPGCDYNRLIFDKWATEDYDYFANTVLEDDEARQYITGVSYQWGGKIAIQRTFESWWPELRLMQSENECGFGDNTWEYATYVWTMLKHYIGNGAESYMYWNLILAPWGVSTWGDPQNAMVTVQNGDYTLNPDFYVMKHFSNAVQRGAVRLGAAGHWAADALIFRNPDGSYAVEAFNPFREEKYLTVELEGEVTSFMLAPRSFNSMIITV